MVKLAFILSHPIQYYSPLFRLFAGSGDIQLKVFYTWSQARETKFDPGFGKEIAWDIPMLDGYDYEFVENTAKRPGSDHFMGLINPGLIKAVESWQPDLLLVVGWNFQSHLKAMRYFKGKVPVLFRGDSTLLDESPGVKKYLRRLFLRWIYRHIDYALYTGTHNKEYFLRHGLTERQLVFAPHAIDNTRFASAGGPAEVPFRQQAGIKDGDVVLLFAGKIEPKKNPFFLLELARRISDDRLKFLVVGNGVQEAEFKQQAETDKRFFFLNFQNQLQMPSVYRAGDIFILPSLGPGETWGLAVNEAMACGRPVIVSEKAGGAIDLVEDGKNGMIIKNNDHAAVTEFISRILSDRSLLAPMGERSRKIVEQFSFTRFVGAVRSIAKNKSI